MPLEYDPDKEDDDDEEENEENEEENADDVVNADDLIDAREVLQRVRDYPLCGYFIETRKNAKYRSAMSWLEQCDKDTIAMICQYAKKASSSSNDEHESKEENTSKDIFDIFDEVVALNNRNESEGIETVENKLIEKIPTDEDDFYSLVLLILSWENDSFFVDQNDIGEACFSLQLYSNVEELRRVGLIKAKGNGKLLSKGTEYILTKKGQNVNKKKLKSILNDFNKIDVNKKENKENKAKKPRKNK